MKKILFITMIAALVVGCSPSMSPMQKIARQISIEYKALGMKDSAAYWKKISKEKNFCGGVRVIEK